MNAITSTEFAELMANSSATRQWDAIYNVAEPARQLFIRAAENDRAPQAVAEIVRSASGLLTEPDTECAGRALILAALEMHTAGDQNDYAETYALLQDVYILNIAEK